MTRACICGAIAVPERAGASATRPRLEQQAKQGGQDAMYSSSSYRDYRRRVLAAKPRCTYPGRTRVADTLDHIVAVSLGGTNEPSNLRRCRKHNQDLGRELGNRMKRRRQPYRFESTSHSSGARGTTESSIVRPNSGAGRRSEL